MINRNSILAYAMRYQGNWSKIAQAITNQESYNSISSVDSYITILDDDYPDCLKELRFPPWILFYEGDIHLLEDEKVSIVGSRDCSSYGMKCTKEVVSHLSRKQTIVSGLAKGIDACAHHYAISYRHHTIGVIGCGLNIVYPKQNQDLYQELSKNHLIISEYPRNTLPRKEHFPWRNRIIAALGKALIVTEAKRHSGTLLTVNEAITLNRDIYCIPYPYDDLKGEGCNLLISQGAIILNDLSMLDTL